MMEKEIIVVKYGSSSVTNAMGMDQKRLKQYVANLAHIQERYGLIIVSSGSVAAGRYIVNVQSSSKQDVDARVLAMLGSGMAFTAWQQELLYNGILSGQLLITHREVEDPTEGPSLVAALEANLRNNIVTIANENDALSDTELAKLSYGGDNDGLAAHIAIKIHASALFLITDKDGLLTKDAQVVTSVDATESQWNFAKKCVEVTTSKEGRGGMMSKVEAAIKTADQGIDTYITNANDPIDEILKHRRGTHFVAKSTNNQ